MLRTKRCTNRPLSENKVMELFIQICLGLQAIHEKRILHRDLKTQNIFLTKQNQIRIGDFGLARQDRDGKQGLPGRIPASLESI